MPHTATQKIPWSDQRRGRWYRWRGYTVRWLLFGLIVSVFQPATSESNPVWLQKLDQVLMGLSFGAACAAVFTLAENQFNAARVTWKSWLIVLGTWLVVKVLFVSGIALIG